MTTYTFGEKIKESIYDKESRTYKDCAVWKTPKYEQSKKKAIELIESKEYGLCEGDFWILMNSTKSGKMNYTGLIISHNACLKINDKLKEKFGPESVTIDKDGFGNSLVFTYSNPTQFIYEVGEVSTKNCKNDYPYAMGLKRLFDRVVLKLSKIAFDGIYSEAESEDFKQGDEVEPVKAETKTNPDKKYLEQLKKCKDLDELKTVFKTNFSKVTNKDEFTALKDEMKAKLEANNDN